MFTGSSSGGEGDLQYRPGHGDHLPMSVSSNVCLILTSLSTDIGMYQSCKLTTAGIIIQSSFPNLNFAFPLRTYNLHPVTARMRTVQTTPPTKVGIVLDSGMY